MVGTHTDLSNLGEAVFDDRGKPTRMVGSIQDIHNGKVAEEGLRRKSVELEQFNYFASHDLQAPLRHITAFVRLLEQDLGQHLSEDATKSDLA